MKIRIRFASEIALEGNTVQEIADKWETLPLYSKDTKIDYIEVESAERVDDKSYKDYTYAF